MEWKRKEYRFILSNLRNNLVKQFFFLLIGFPAFIVSRRVRDFFPSRLYDFWYLALRIFGH